MSESVRNGLPRAYGDKVSSGGLFPCGPVYMLECASVVDSYRAIYRGLDNATVHVAAAEGLANGLPAH